MPAFLENHYTLTFWIFTPIKSMGEGIKLGRNGQALPLFPQVIQDFQVFSPSPPREI